MNNKKFAVAVDIGGTKILTALFGNDYYLLNKKQIEFKKEKFQPDVYTSRQKVFKLLCNSINDVKGSKKIKGIGVCIPDVINKNGAIVGNSKIKSFSDFELGKELKKKFKCDVKVANDADAFALGEQRLGAGKGFKNVVGIIFGTGIGSGIILNSKIYTGTSGSSGEFGHNIVNPLGPKGRIGLKGTVEAYAGSADLVRNYIQAGGRMKNPSSYKIYKSNEVLAKKIKSDALLYLAIGLAGIMNFLNPDIIIIGGGQSKQPVYKELNRLTKKFSIPGVKKNVKIVKNKLGDNAGIYGAAALIFENNVFN